MTHFRSCIDECRIVPPAGRLQHKLTYYYRRLVYAVASSPAAQSAGRSERKICDTRREDGYRIKRIVSPCRSGGTDQFLLHQSRDIPQRETHRLTSIGIDLRVPIEVQCGKYMGEDDIVRPADTYRRA